MWKFPKLYNLEGHPPDSSHSVIQQDNVHFGSAVPVFSRRVHFCLTFLQRQFTFEECDRGFSVEGMCQNDVQVLKSKERRSCSPRSTGFQEGPGPSWFMIWTRGGRGWYFTCTAQGGCSLQLHGKSVACSWVFFSLERDCVPILHTGAQQGKVIC